MNPDLAVGVWGKSLITGLPPLPRLRIVRPCFQTPGLQRGKRWSARR